MSFSIPEYRYLPSYQTDNYRIGSILVEVELQGSINMMIFGLAIILLGIQIHEADAGIIII